MKKWRNIAIVMASIMFIGCGGGAGSTEGNHGGSSSSSSSSSSSGGGSSIAHGTLKVKNSSDSCDAIKRVYFMDSDSSPSYNSFGADRLSGWGKISSGSSFSFRLYEEDVTRHSECGQDFDIKVVYDNDAEFYSYSKYIPCNQTTTLTFENSTNDGCSGNQQDDDYGTIKIINSSSSSRHIYYVYLSRSTSSSWGPDQLGSDTIAPGYSHSWHTSTTSCDINYDIKVEYSDGTTKQALGRYIACGITTSFTVNNY
jgi:hypothetical protein